MKIGLVCPYIYPEAGGVAQHVRFLYENLRLRRPRRPDRHRQPRTPALVGGRHPAHRGRVLDADQRLGRDADVLAALHHPGPAPARARALRPAPLPRAVRAVPVAVHAARIDERERRHLPRLRRLLAVVRARQPDDARPCRPPPRPDRGQRRGPPLHRPLLPGRLQGDPERRRHRPLRQRRAARALAGRHAERPVRRPARAAQGAAGPPEGPADPAQDRLRHAPAGRRVRAAGTRGPSVRGDARSPGRRSSSAASPRRRRRSSTGRRRSSRRRPPVANRSGSSCSRRWPPALRSSPRTSTATRASSDAAGRACWSRRATRRPSRWPSPAWSTNRPSGPRWVRTDASGPRTSAGRASRPRSRSTTASSSGGSRPRRAACRRASGADPSGAAAAREAVGVALGIRGVVDQRQPPDPGGVGDHQAGHDDRREEHDEQSG